MTSPLIMRSNNSQEGVLAWVSERLAVSMRQAEDLILRDYIVSAASQLMAGGGSNNDNPTNLGVSDFSLAATTLDTNNAYKFMSGIEGMDRFGTGPVRSSYFMLSSTELQSDFDAMVGSGFKNQWDYKRCVVLKPWVIDLECLSMAA